MSISELEYDSILNPLRAEVDITLSVIAVDDCSDDVLAKWMALTADERRLIADANMHLPGRQIDPDRVRRDLLRLSRWERERIGQQADSVRAA